MADELSFQEMLQNEMLYLYDTEWFEYLNQAASGMTSDYDIQEFVSPVVSVFLVDLYIDSPERFKSLMKIIRDEFLISKQLSNAMMRRSNLKLITNEKPPFPNQEN